MEDYREEVPMADQKDFSPSAFTAEAQFEIGGRPILSSCVDGRYPPAEAEAAPMSRAGADAGDLLIVSAALRRLGRDDLREQAMELALVAAGGPENFRFHTDDHHMRGGSEDTNPQNLVARGCGHLAKAEQEPAAYGLTAEDMAAIFAKLIELKSRGAKEIILTGAHNESAVFAVEDKKIGLRHTVPSAGQAFVFHAGWHAERLGELGRRLAALTGRSEAEVLPVVREISQIQTGATLERLAKGLPIIPLGEAGAEAAA